MVNGANIQLSATEAEIFLHNLMYPTEESIEARRNFLQEIENDIRVERNNNETMVYSEQINENALRYAINRRKQKRNITTCRRETGTVPPVRHTDSSYMTREYRTVFEDRIQPKESCFEENQTAITYNFSFLIDSTANLAA